MKSLEHQLVDYFELQEDVHPRITPDEVTGSPVRVSTPVRGSTGIWWAGAAAAVVVLVIGGAGLLASQLSSDDPASEPVTTAVVVDASDPSSIATSFVRARSDGYTDAVLAVLAEDAVVDIGPASSRGDIAAEMRWQDATGLAFTFDRCEPANAPPEYGDASFSCYVTWTGPVAGSYEHGPDTFEYTIDVAGDKIVSVALVDLGDYQATTWKPFRDWMLEQHPGDVATIYTQDGHAVLTDESIELWRIRTNEFVVERTSTNTASTSSPGTPIKVEPMAMKVGDSHSVMWTQLVPATFREPFRVFDLPNGEFVAAPADLHLAGTVLFRSSDGRNWTEHSEMELLFSEDPVVWLEGNWAATEHQDRPGPASMDRSLWRYFSGEWRPVAVPGDITRFNAPTRSGDTILIAGWGPTRHVIIRSDSDGDPVVHEMPWSVTGDGLPHAPDEFRVVTAPDGSVVAFVQRMARFPQDGEESLDNPRAEVWTSRDGQAWVSQGNADLAWGDSYVTFADYADALVAMAQIWPDRGDLQTKAWTSSDGIDWDRSMALDGLEEIATLSNGYLVANRTGGPAVLSVDDGASWTEIPDHPEDPDGEFNGFSLYGFAGDLWYHSGDDGLWVAYLN